MSVTLRAGSGGSDNTAPTSLVPILPVGTDIGDLTLIFVECTNVNVSYGPATGGWQKLAEHAYAGSTNLAGVIYARVWDTTPASPTIIFSDGGSNGGSISWSAISFSPGAGGTLVVDNASDSGRDYNTGTSMAVNAETANAAEVASVIFSGQRSNSVTAGTTIGSTMPTGWIQPTGVSRSTTASTFGNIGTNIGYQLAQSGTIAPGNVTMNRAASASIFHFTIAEVAAATPASIKAVGTVVNGGSAATSITLPTPASAAAGDYLVAVLYNSVGTGSTDWAMGSTGFARIGPAYIAADAAQRTGGLYGQRLTAAPPSSYTFATPDSSATRNVGVIIVLSNVDATTPVSVSTAWTETNGTATSLAIPGGGNGNDLTLEYIAADFTAGNTYAGAANDSGLTSQAVLLSPSGTENTTVSRTMVRIYGGIAPTGGVPSHTFSTTGSSSHRAAFLISFKGSNAAAAPALTASAAFSGSGALSAAAATGSSTTMTAYLTGYGYPDNDPPNSDAIAYPNAQHSVAGGVGTYADPISMATASGEWTAGTMFYVPNLRRYFRIEDLCVGCSGTRPGGTSTWLDLWVGGKTGGYTTAQTLAVENALTGAHTVIKNPPSNYVVVPGDIVATGYTSYSETPVTASNALTATAALSGSGALAASATTGRTPVTVYRGVNDSGAEFGSTYPGVYNTDYHYSGSASLTYLSGRGHRLIRLPIAWERIQRTLGGALDAGELGRINTYLSSAAAAGLVVVVDVHNYAGYDSGSGVVKMGVAGGPTTAQFADLWTKLSTAFKTNTAVIAYGLMNEPNGLAAGLWKTASQAAVTAIRNNGDTKLLMVAGDHWSNVDGWSGYNGSTSWITDPASNFRYEGHHYFADSSTFVYSTENTNAINQGWSAGAYSDPLTNKTLTNLANWKTWLASAGVGGFIGEVGWPQNASPHTGDYAQWNTLADKWYASCDAGKVWVTAWAAGEWWSSTSQYAIYDTSGGVMAIPHTQETVLLAHPSFGTSSATATAALTGSGTLATTATPKVTRTAAATGSGALAAASGAAKTSTFTDDFATANAAKWTGIDGTNVLVTGGQLRVNTANSYFGASSTGHYDLTNSTLSVEIAQIPNLGNGTTSAYLHAVVDANNEVSISWEGGQLNALYKKAGVSNVVSLTYNATAHRVWRIRESGGTLYWEGSASGSTWTNLRTPVATPLTLSSVQVVLNSGYYGTETSPGAAIFDNVNATYASPPPSPRTFYVDPAGSDAADGLAAGTAWATIAKVNTAALFPGDTVLLKRDATWTGTTLTVSGSGSSVSPITIGAYGTGGVPIIFGGGSSGAAGTIDTCQVYGSWIVLDSIEFRGAASTDLFINGTDCTVQGCVVRWGVYGIHQSPQAARLKVLYNTVADVNVGLIGPGTDDDTGASAILLEGDAAEVAFNTISGSAFTSPDYGVDGSAIEVWGATNATIHNNRASDCVAFTELGNTATNNITYYNNIFTSSISISNGFVVHGDLYDDGVTDDPFGPVTGTKIYHNTVVLTGSNPTGVWMSPNGEVDFRNNVIVVAGTGTMASIASTNRTVTEAGNVFWQTAGATSKISLPAALAASSIVADPKFASSTDLRLLVGSPAIDRGINLGYSEDFTRAFRPQGAAPDSGAYEGAITPAATSASLQLRAGTGLRTAHTVRSGPIAPTVSSTAAILSGTGTLTASSRVSGSAPAALNGAGALTATTSSSTSGTATIALSGSGTLSATTRAARTAPAVLAGTGALTAGASGTSGLLAQAVAYRIVSGAWQIATVQRL